MWRFLIIYSAFCGYFGFSNVYEYRVNPGPKYPPTKGEVWPRAYQEMKEDTYYTFYPFRFQFKITNHNCSVLTRALSRCVYALRQLNGIAKRSRLRAGRARPALSSARGPDDDNYLGTLKQLKINLEQPCEEYPYFDMDENYTLHISPSSQLRSKSIWGILRGLETFTQLFYLSDDYNEVRVNTTTVCDAPRYAHRGLLIDTSRHYLSTESVLRIVDAMAINKMNVLHWHIVDDQSFPYQSERFPELSERGAYFPTMIYTRADIENVIAQARDRGIRVVPEFDVPGHTRSWGNAYPSILTQCYREGAPAGLGPMHPLRNATYKLLRGLLAEVRALFPDRYLHVGGDEVDLACWESNPELSEFMKKNGMNSSELHALFMRNAIQLLDNSTKVIVWQEVFDEKVPLAKDTLVQVWKDVTANEMNDILTAGYQVLYSASWYLDHLEDGFPQMYAADPRRMVRELTQNASLAAGVVGGEACMWGEMADDRNALSRIWPRASAVAEVLWSPEPQGAGSGSGSTLRRIEEHTCRMIRRGVPAQPPSGPGFCVV